MLKRYGSRLMSTSMGGGSVMSVRLAEKKSAAEKICTNSTDACTALSPSPPPPDRGQADGRPSLDRPRYARRRRRCGLLALLSLSLPLLLLSTGVGVLGERRA